MKRILVWAVIVAIVGAVVVTAARRRPIEVEAVPCRRGTAEAFVTEEAETRLDDEYVIAMPVNGRLLRIDLKEGALVEKGSVIAQVDAFERREQLKQLEAQVKETEALIVGVDEAKPKAEDIRGAELAVDEAKLRRDAAQKALEVCRINYAQEKKLHEQNGQLFRQGALPETMFIESERRFLMLGGNCDEAEIHRQAMQNLLEQSAVKLKRLRDSVDDNEFERARFQAQIQEITARQAILRDEIVRSDVRAPVSGPVLEKYQEDEQVLSAGTPLLNIGDLDSIRVEADILSEDVGRVKLGQPVELFGPAVGGGPIRGQVARIYPSGFEKISSLGIEQQRVKVIMEFDNSELQLRPGVRLDVRVITDRKENALLVPERALFKASGRWRVFVVRNGTAQPVAVNVGIRNDELAEITDGLAEGELIIPDPPPDLEAGAKVKLSGQDR